MSVISPRSREETQPLALPRTGPEPSPARAGRRTGRPRLSGADRDILWLYLLTRTAIWTTAYCARWIFPADAGTRDPGPALDPFERWDWGHFLNVARDGYFPAGDGPWNADWDNREAFFPGFPLALRAVHMVVPHWTAAGLLISFVAGGIAVLALARVARLYLPDAKAGRRTVQLLLLSPCAVFLAAGYSESLFLALALPAWLAAHRHNWPLAATLAALATTVRISGLFLAAALALHFVLTARTRADWGRLPWLALPALPAVLFAWYLHAHTGDWMAWKHAQERGWYRRFHAPWEAWSTTWESAFGHVQATGYAFMFQAELLTMLVGLALAVLLIRRRRWPEAAYIVLSLWALGTSYWYTSIPRATLLWWPLWITLAAWSLRSPRFRTAYYCLVAPLSTVFALTYLTGRWAG